MAHECIASLSDPKWWRRYTPIHRKTGSCMKARPKGHRSKTWRTEVISVARLHCATIAQRIEKI